MKCAIIGWYGTETIGDRAILASLIKLFQNEIEENEIFIGSIYPFFTERTLFEDRSFIEKMCMRPVKIAVFDSRNHFELKKNIGKVDCLVVGGGPLMDVSWMYMIEYALMKAKKLGKKTALLGCGLGPLYRKEYINSTRNILRHSDVLIFRDEASRQAASVICPEKATEMIALIDPAAITAAFFKRQYIDDSGEVEYVAMNLREFPSEYLTSGDKDIIGATNQWLKKLTLDTLEVGLSIRLIPMHYFGIGGDDRVFLNRIVNQIEAEDLSVQNVPLSLEQTMSIYAGAKYCVGMRFHSIVLQTIVNGNNYLIDYTAPKKGKTSGFINAIGGVDFYNNRYINVQDRSVNRLRLSDDRFNIRLESIDYYEKQFRDIMMYQLLV